MLNLFESVHNEMETKSLVINHNCEDTDEIIAEKSEQNCCVVLKEPASQTECQGYLFCFPGGDLLTGVSVPH